MEFKHGLALYLLTRNLRSICTHRHHNRHNTIQNSVDFVWIAILEANIADANNFVKIIFNSFRRFLLRDFSTQTFEVLSQLLRLKRPKGGRILECIPSRQFCITSKQRIYCYFQGEILYFAVRGNKARVEA